MPVFSDVVVNLCALRLFFHNVFVMYSDYQRDQNTIKHSGPAFYHCRHGQLGTFKIGFLFAAVIKPRYSQSSISLSHFQNPISWRIFLWATCVVSVKPVQSPVLWWVEANMIHGGKSQYRKRRELNTGSWGLGAPHTLVAAIKSRATLSGLGFCLPEELCVPAQTQGLSSFLSHEKSEKHSLEPWLLFVVGSLLFSCCKRFALE